MNSRFFIITVVVATLILPVGAVAAQEETNSSTPTATPTGEKTTVELSPTTRIVEWRHVNGTFEIVVESKTPTRVTLTDAGKLSRLLGEQGGAKTAKVNMRTYNVGAGKTTIRFDAETVDGESAVTVSALNSDGLAVIRTGAIGGGNPPIDWGTANALVGGAALISAAGTYRYVKKKRDEQTMTAERKL